MLIGYTILDPLVVILGTLFAAYLICFRPVLLMAFLPAILSLYFFIPGITNLTLWQTVPLLLIGRLVLLGRLRLAYQIEPIFSMAIALIVLGFTLALVDGTDQMRATIRLIHYTSLIAVLLFCYEMMRHPDGYRLFLKGLAVTGVVFAVYGTYQILAWGTGLPYRGIVRSLTFTQAAFEGGQLRINSFADEPKRLGFVLFVSGLACFFYGDLQIVARRRLRLRWAGVFVLLMSLMTFAGSYFLALALFLMTALLIYPGRMTLYFYTLAAVAAGVLLFFPEHPIVEAFIYGYERRMNEIEVGLDGTRVYRQEFYARDYLGRYPERALFGVGMGQYFGVLFHEYGPGAGLSMNGNLLPLNSNFFELLFDLGGVAAILFYASLVWIIVRLRKARERFLALSLLFLLLQSLTILTTIWMVMLLGVSLGRLSQRQDKRTNAKGQVPNFLRYNRSHKFREQ